MIFCQGNVREMSGNFEPTQMWQPCNPQWKGGNKQVSQKDKS